MSVHQHYNTKNMENSTQKEWKSLISEDEHAVIIDVRRPEEWQQGIIESAVMMNIMDFEGFQQKSKDLDLSKNYYVYCRSGVRSLRACDALESFGVKTTYNLLGGILAWDGDTVIPSL